VVFLFWSSEKSHEEPATQPALVTGLQVGGVGAQAALHDAWTHVVSAPSVAWVAPMVHTVGSVAFPVKQSRQFASALQSSSAVQQLWAMQSLHGVDGRIMVQSIVMPPVVVVVWVEAPVPLVEVLLLHAAHGSAATTTAPSQPEDWKLRQRAAGGELRERAVGGELAPRIVRGCFVMGRLTIPDPARR
jgi:hypothetical protein